MPDRPLTKEHLIKDYLNLKDELGRQPTSKEYETKCHSMMSIRYFFGSWVEFLDAAKKLGIEGT